jgi:hypothetical protein
VALEKSPLAMWPVVAKAEEERELASKLYLKKMTHWHRLTIV